MPKGGREPPDLPQHLPITPEQLDLVIRRATDLQFKESADVGDSLTTADVLEIGAEVGLGEGYLRQALGEMRAASHLPAGREDHGLAYKIAGSGIISASRVVSGDVPEIEDSLGRYFREKEHLLPVRNKAGWSVWESNAGIVSQMVRALDMKGHGYKLAKARNVEVSLESLEPGWTLVSLVVDARNARTERISGWLLGAAATGVIGGGSIVLALGTGALPILGATAFLGGDLWLGRVLARKTMTSYRKQLELAVDGILDRLERGELIDPEGESWQDRLRRFGKRALPADFHGSDTHGESS